MINICAFLKKLKNLMIIDTLEGSYLQNVDSCDKKYI